MPKVSRETHVLTGSLTLLIFGLSGSNVVTRKFECEVRERCKRELVKVGFTGLVKDNPSYAATKEFNIVPVLACGNYQDHLGVSLVIGVRAEPLEEVLEGCTLSDDDDHNEGEKQSN